MTGLFLQVRKVLVRGRDLQALFFQQHANVPGQRNPKRAIIPVERVPLTPLAFLDNAGVFSSEGRAHANPTPVGDAGYGPVLFRASSQFRYLVHQLGSELPSLLRIIQQDRGQVRIADSFGGTAKTAFAVFAHLYQLIDGPHGIVTHPDLHEIGTLAV